MTPQELRAEADRLEKESAQKYKGRIFIMPSTGTAYVHDGNSLWFHEISHREASEAEVNALCTIPEFATHFKRIRGEA